LLVLAWWLVRRLRLRRVSAPAASEPALKLVHTTLADPLYIVVSLGTAILVGLLTWGLTFYSNAMLVDGATDMFVTTLTSIVVVLAYVLLLAGPVIWLAAVRHDWRVAVYVIAWQVVWLIVLLLIFVLGIRPLLPDGSVVSPNIYS
jgi:hypothetical protein